MKRYYLAAVILVLIAVAAGVASTLVTRPQVTDRIVAQDLRTLDSEILGYHRQTQTLPASLKQLKLTGDITGRLDNYEFSTGSTSSAALGRLSQITFTLCASFKTATDVPTTMIYPATFNPEAHNSGHECFTDFIPSSESATPRPL